MQFTVPSERKCLYIKKTSLKYDNLTHCAWIHTTQTLHTFQRI